MSDQNLQSQSDTQSMRQYGDQNVGQSIGSVAGNAVVIGKLVIEARREHSNAWREVVVSLGMRFAANVAPDMVLPYLQDLIVAHQPVLATATGVLQPQEVLVAGQSDGAQSTVVLLYQLDVPPETGQRTLSIPVVMHIDERAVLPAISYTFFGGGALHTTTERALFLDSGASGTPREVDLWELDDLETRDRFHPLGPQSHEEHAINHTVDHLAQHAVIEVAGGELAGRDWSHVFADHSMPDSLTLHNWLVFHVNQVEPVDAYHHGFTHQGHEPIDPTHSHTPDLHTLAAFHADGHTIGQDHHVHPHDGHTHYGAYDHGHLSDGSSPDNLT